MRIVLDTNVVLSALLWRGTPNRLLQTITGRDQAKLFSSVVLLDELVGILTRPSPTKRLALLGRSAWQVVADYLEIVDIVTPLASPRVVADDPDDDQVVAAAVAAGADFIVSGDRHLLSLGSHQTIRILSPADAIAVINR